MKLIELRDVSKTFHTWFDRKPVLTNINLSICQGEFVVLVGENGAGKTTLVNLILGLMTPSSGEVNLMGLSPKSPESKNHVGVVFQEANLPENMKVKELIRLVRSYYPNARSTEELLSAFKLDKKQDNWVAQLSGGWKQRLYFALALASNPELLILDEPTKEMDDSAYEEFWKQIENCQTRGVAILMVTHLKSDRERLTKMANRIVTLHSMDEVPASGQLSENLLDSTLKVTQSDKSSVVEQLSSSQLRSVNHVNLFIQQFWAEILQLLRTPLFLFGILLFAGISAVIPGGNEITMIGLSGLTLLTIAFDRVGKRVAIERKNRWLKFLRSTPLPADIYIAVKVSTALLIGVFSLILIFVLNARLHPLPEVSNWATLLLSLLVGIVPFTFLGLGLSYSIDPKSYDSIAGLIIPVGIATCGIPVFLSPIVQDLVAFSPFYHYAQLVLSTVGSGDHYLWIHLLWLAWTGFAFGAVAVWTYQQDRAIQ